MLTELFTHCRSVGMTTDGAFAEYCLVDSRSCALIPERFSFAQACPMSCAGTTIFTAIRRAGLKPGQSLGMVGLGALGVLGVQMSQAMGFKTVGFDSRPEPVELAKTFKKASSGPADYLVFTADTPQEQALEQIQAMEPEKEWAGLDAVVLCTDAQESFAYATSLLRNHGTFVLVGAPEQGITFQYHDLIFRDILIKGSLLGSREDLQQCLELCTEHNIQVSIFDGLCSR